MVRRYLRYSDNRAKTPNVFRVVTSLSLPPVCARWQWQKLISSAVFCFQYLHSWRFFPGILLIFCDTFDPSPFVLLKMQTSATFPSGLLFFRKKLVHSDDTL